MEKNGSLTRIGETLLPAIAYGDAAGLPVETKSFDYIAERYGQIKKLLPATGNIYFKGDYPPGTTSDDTQLSIAVMNALIKSNGFDLRSMADEHIVAYENTPGQRLKDGRVKKLGWGSSTADSILRIIEGVSPFESGAPGGTGNGILMKMAPLAYWNVARSVYHPRNAQYDLLTNMTHDSEVARIATRVHGNVLTGLLEEPNAFRPHDFTNNLPGIVNAHERGTACKDVGDALWPLLRLPNSTDATAEIKGWYAGRRERMPDDEFGKSYGFYVPETLALAYAAFLRGSLDYEDTVYGAATMGGDADSIASIAGTMVAFARGGEIDLPDDAVNVKDMDVLRALSSTFTRAALS